MPVQDVLESSCNMGYASGCSWAPSQRLYDSVRFSVSGPAQDSVGRASVVLLIYILERDHRPVERGQLEFDVKESVWRAPHPDPRIQKMAECFLESFMKRRA